MGVRGIGGQSLLLTRSLVAMRTQLGDLQRQLGTGKKSDTYAGMGVERGLAVGLRSQLAAIKSYGDSITSVDVRLNLAESTLSRIAQVGTDVKALTAPTITGGTQITQQLAHSALSEILGLLNTQAGERYLFSGLAADTPAVATPELVLDGDLTRAGLKQIISERKQADLGASGLGRLVISAPSATSVQLAEDVAGSPFGFKLTSISSGLTGSIVAGPAGAPPAMSVDLGVTIPNPGETVRFTFALPDGSSETLTLTATASATPGPNEFTLGATPAATAANLQATLTASLTTLANTALSAASAYAAASDFFDIDAANPPQRVAGPPFNTATALINGTATNTVYWYTGEAGPDPARSTVTARVDRSITVSFGLRANEQGIRWVVQNLAAVAATTIVPTDPNAAAQSTALNLRLADALVVPAGIQKIQTIAADLAGAHDTVQAAKERHRQTTSTLTDLLQNIEGIPQEQVGAEILALQTNLQASLQVTAMLYKTSLVNFI